jgi:hypothetical protein
MSSNTKGSRGETLYDRVSRQKHRWLKRVMSDPAASSSEKCFAYIVMDKLNCATLDSWPGQALIAQLLGRKSTKTAHRVAFGLERRNHLRISRDTGGFYRYAPVFLTEDEDKSDGNAGHSCPPMPDKTVDESSLGILSNKSSPSSDGREASKYSSSAPSNYRRNQRGLYEVELAKLLGNNGSVVLERLSELNDAIVERLCRALADGLLGQREILAARLAADQQPRKRRPT